jgi:hypothetical protein
MQTLKHFLTGNKNLDCFIKQAKIFIQRKTTQPINYAFFMIFKLRSTPEQMPALVFSKTHFFKSQFSMTAATAASAAGLTRPSVLEELVERVVVLVHGHRRVVVQPLGHQHLGQLALGSGTLLDLGALVLEPDLDLVLVEAQLARQALPPLLREVPVVVELPLEPRQLGSI